MKQVFFTKLEIYCAALMKVLQVVNTVSLCYIQSSQYFFFYLNVKQRTHIEWIICLHLRACTVTLQLNLLFFIQPTRQDSIQYLIKAYWCPHQYNPYLY